jgi:hypothetical protein
MRKLVHPRRSRFAGAILFEIVMAVGLLALIVAAVAQTGITFLAHQRRASMQEYAARETANLIDIASAVPFDDLTAENLSRAAPLAKAAKSELDGEVAWQVDEMKLAANGLVGRRVEVTLRWSCQGLGRSTTLRAWRFDAAPVGEDSTP